MALRSMTGVGQVTLPLELPGRTLSVDVELRSVNSRFLECLIKTPLCALHERAAQAQVAKALGRGRVELRLGVHQDELAQSQGAKISQARMRSVFADIEAIEASARSQGLDLAPVSALEIYRLAKEDPEGSAARPSELLETLWKTPQTRSALEQALAQALSKLVEMRECEGASLAAQIHQEAQGLSGCLEQVEAVREAMAPQMQARLQERLTQLLGAPCADRVQEVGPERIAAELAVLMARADVQEELVRIAAHLRQVFEILDEASNVGQGKRLNFLCQELGREWSTVGAKLADPAAGKIIVAAKSYIERIREQAQNVE